MYINVKVKGSKEDVKKVLDVFKRDNNKSKCIRDLLLLGVESKEIKKLLGVSDNFISNKIIDLRVGGKIKDSDIIRSVNIRSNKSVELKEKVLKMKNEGMKIIDISIKLGINYNRIRSLFNS